MARVAAPRFRVGLSNTPANNFTLDATAADGTMKLHRGNELAGTQDIITVDAAGKVNFPVSKAIETPVKDALNASGSAPVYPVRAWVFFNGTGTIAVLASGNVSSVTDVGLGEYTVNMAVALPDANYAEVPSCGNSTSTQAGAYVAGTKTASAYKFRTVNEGSNSLTDFEWVSVIIVR